MVCQKSDSQTIQVIGQTIVWFAKKMMARAATARQTIAWFTQKSDGQSSQTIVWFVKKVTIFIGQTIVWFSKKVTVDHTCHRPDHSMVCQKSDGQSRHGPPDHSGRHSSMTRSLGAPGPGSTVGGQ